MSTKYGGGDSKCVNCGLTAYATERMIVEGKTVHTACFKCTHCKRQLTLSNFAMVNKVWYCKPHFVELFKTSGGKYDVFGAYNGSSSSGGGATIAAASAAASKPVPTVTPSSPPININANEQSKEQAAVEVQEPEAPSLMKQGSDDIEDTSVSDVIPAALREKFQKAGQDHVFDFVDRGMVVDDEEINSFVSQLKEIPIDSINQIFEGADGGISGVGSGIAPLPKEALVTIDEVAQNEREWRNLGLHAIANGHVAVVVLAGGQGTRLGFDGPKGKYDIGLPSRKSLFQLQAEKLLATERVANAPKHKPIPYYVMTSPLNDAETRAFFSENDYFGLDSRSVFFFSQGTLPCLSIEPPGKIILETKSSIASAPDGNGGVYTSLKSSGAFEDMERRGVQWIHIVSVDNALVKMADPVFVGCCIAKNAQVGNKTVRKSSWDEAVGVMAVREGKFQVVEYSEMDKTVAASKNEEDGTLLFGSANICNHLFSLSFIRDVAIPNLTKSYHIARKKIPFADPVTGETIHPTINNGIKLELFVFDVFPLAQSVVVVESLRENEFAPVKNAANNDSPATAVRAISSLHRGWLKLCGVDDGAEEDADAAIEISPLLCLDEIDAVEHLKPILGGIKLQPPFQLRQTTESSVRLVLDSHPNVHQVIDPDSSCNIYEVAISAKFGVGDGRAEVALNRLRQVDINNTTPMQAFLILAELQQLLS